MLKQTHESEARVFWGIDAEAGPLQPELRGDECATDKHLPNLVWLRVFLEANFHVPAQKLGEALAYEMGLMPKQRKRLIFKSIPTAEAEEEAAEKIEIVEIEILKFSDILTLDIQELLPFKRSWTGELEKIRNTPRTRKPQQSQVSEGQLNLVSEVLHDLVRDGLDLWKSGPENKINSYRTTFFCSTYSRDVLKNFVLENIPRVIRSHRTKGVKSPAESVVDKALTELVWFRSNKKKSKA